MYTYSSFCQELIIGEERIEPGIIIIFEGAIKDQVFPKSNNMEQSNTDIHIEARVNWDTMNIPKGTPEGGFIPYLRINAKIINTNTGLSTFIDLLPHINLIDNFHYARNISLPGKVSDKYDVIFNVIPPSKYDLNLHKDWEENYGYTFFDEVKYKYLEIDFEEIATSSR
tara:strand:- start:135 stop:641 length:507 start_codon:yes stop_codon:yes gene_type:complete